MILGVLEIDWNFIDFLDHPNLRQHGQEVVKGSSPGAYSNQTDCQQDAIFEGIVRKQAESLESFEGIVR